MTLRRATPRRRFHVTVSFLSRSPALPGPEPLSGVALASRWL